MAKKFAVIFVLSVCVLLISHFSSFMELVELCQREGSRYKKYSTLNDTFLESNLNLTRAVVESANQLQLKGIPCSQLSDEVADQIQAFVFFFGFNHCGSTVTGRGVEIKEKQACIFLLNTGVLYH